MDKQPAIFLVDDDIDDLMLLKYAFLAADSNCTFTEFIDGHSAIQQLKYAQDNNTLPELIILDINMPIISGREILAIIKMEEKLKHLPVVVFTTSSNPADINYCKQFNVDLVTKPFDLEHLLITARIFLSYIHP